MKYTYPACKTEDKVEDWFGTQLADPYAWLRDGKDPEVLDFVARENAYTDEYFASRPLAEKIAELKAKKLPELPGSLTPWKGGYIGTLNLDGDYQIHQFTQELEDKGELPHPSELPANVPLFSAAPCPGGNEDVMALMVLHPGAARPSVLVWDMAADKIQAEFSDVFSMGWSKTDNKLYFSSTEADSEKQESHSVFLRYDPVAKESAVVYEDDSYSIFGQVHISQDGRTVMAMVCQDYAVARWIAIDAAIGSTQVLTKEAVEWKYIDSLDDGHYFIQLSGTDRGQVIRLDAKGSCTIVLPQSDLLLDTGLSVQGKLFVLACQDASSRLVEVATGTQIELPTSYGFLQLAGETKNGVMLRFESFLIAPELLSFDGKTLKVEKTTCSAVHDDLTVEQHFAPSTGDGEKIPYYLVRRKDAKPDGSAPVIMYAYGGYNISSTPWYQDMVTGLTVSDWVEQGGIYVVCNLRGGNEYGPKWHEAGMMQNKRHCYEDFIGVAEELIAKGWTKAGRIGIDGCSNGGLLMSALVTMRPDLWGCVIDSVPHTDMIHFAEDDRGPMYITEYGNPRESREMFEYLLSYSPYHNVRKTNYPPTYIQTGEMDNNVPPYHGKKFAARMQAENQSDNPILLRVLAEGSHDRGKGEVYWQTIAEMQLFLHEYLKEN